MYTPFLQIERNLKFNIADCKRCIVGNKNKYSNIKSSWKSTKQNPFYNLNYNRIWCVIKGNGKLTNAEGIFDICEGNTYFVPANSIISTSCDDFMVQYYVEFLQEYPLNGKSNDYKMFFSIKTTDQIINALTTIEKNFLKNNDSSELAVTGSILLILSQMIIQKEDNTTTRIFQNVINYINNNYTKDISLKELSQFTNYNHIYFISLFKKTFNMTPMQLITTKRLVLAQELLVKTDMPISQIAEKCGYSDPLYFSRLFSNHIKCTAMNYRKNNKIIQ